LNADAQRIARERTLPIAAQLESGIEKMSKLLTDDAAAGYERSVSVMASSEIAGAAVGFAAFWF